MSLKWARTSAEHRALYLQIYRHAQNELANRVARISDRWGVVLDIDETVLDNSEFRLARIGRPYDPDAFTAWCAEERATALPGAAAFLRFVQARGGLISLVTNRSSSVCANTKSNLEREGLPFDQVLCDTGKTDKSERLRAIERGHAPSELPPIQVVMWLGDNIEDFPQMTQRTMRAAPESAFDGFGTKYFVLPNPVYGSWVENPFPPPSDR